MIKNIFIAGHNGMVGSSILSRLKASTNHNIIIKNKKDLDLIDTQAVNQFFLKNKIDEVYLAAAKVGGILANSSYPANFLYDNLMIQNNVIHQAYKNGIKKLLFLGSSCIYPKHATQPLSEDALLTGSLEPTNEPYALAKISGIKMCESYNKQYKLDYRSIMPTNLYGPRDNFDLDNSHVIPGLIRKFHNAKVSNSNEVVVWGSGSPRREFLHVDDMAKAAVFTMDLSKEEILNFTSETCSHLNIGTGMDCTIKELTTLIKDIIGFDGKIIFDKTKPDGTPKKLLDVKKINNLGWKHSIELKDGLKQTYNWFLENEDNLRLN